MSLCVSLAITSGLPTARRLDREDVLAGSDFLSVFIHRGERPRTADRPGPFEHHYDREVNSVSHKSSLLDLVKPFSNKYALADIFKSKYGYSVSGVPAEAEDYRVTVPDALPTLETDVRTTTQYTEPTTIGDIPTTVPEDDDKLSVSFPTEDQQTGTTYYESDTQTESTTQKVPIETIEEKVISVRVSSSVARHSHRTVETSTTKSTSEVVSRAKLVDENLVSTQLVTQEEPSIHAVQRSEFTVEESPLPHSENAQQRDLDHPSPQQRQGEVLGNVQEVKRYGSDQQRQLNGKLPVYEIHYHNPPAALISNYDRKIEDTLNDNEPPAHPYRRKEFRQLSPYSRREPISYHSRVSSPTSDSSVNFYREHPTNNQAVAETVHQPVLAEPYPPAAYQRADDKPEASSTSGQESSTYHEEPREQSYAEPEKVYGKPEENYEVDEAVSVITNGKAHGVQESTPPSADQEEQNKFGYVVEGRNFRKYRVEERTADGFIVGEYGVVSHDDGSLRGVRYTADSNINPRLIYDTLVKFLSL